MDKEITETEIIVFSDDDTEERNIRLEYGCDELFYSDHSLIYCSKCGTMFCYDYDAHKDIGHWGRAGYESECPLCNGKMYHIMLVQMLENFGKISEEIENG